MTNGWALGRRPTLAIALTLGALSAVALSSVALASDSLRCGQRLIATGDSSYEVRSACGQPDQVDYAVEERKVRNRGEVVCRIDADGYQRCERGTRERSVEIPIERWTYDFGSNRFLQHLTFEGGQLRSIQRGGYGYKAPAPPGK